MIKKIIGVVLAFALVAVGAVLGVEFTKPSYSLTMDVNPSIEIVSNRLDRVVEVKALNDDAREMLKDFKLKDKNITNTIEDLADLMVLTGYISGGEDNLVSIRVTDGSASEDVLNEINQVIAAYLENKQIEARVVNEALPVVEEVALSSDELDDRVDDLQDKEDDIRDAQDDAKEAKEEKVAKEAPAKSSQPAKQTNTTTAAKSSSNSSKSNTSSKQTLIGNARAKEIALAKTGGGTIVEFELDWDDGRPEYEIEIKRNGVEYELEIHGYTGKILEYEVDDDDDYVKKSTPKQESKPAAKPAQTSKPTLIGDARAKEIALAKTGGGTIDDFELDWDDGRPEYEIEIKKNGVEYELEIDGYTGKILEFEIDD